MYCMFDDLDAFDIGALSSPMHSEFIVRKINEVLGMDENELIKRLNEISDEYPKR